MKTVNSKFYIFIASLVLASLACSIFVGGPDYPEQTIPYSEDQVQTMHDQIEQALASGAETGIITLQITETQLTSFISDRITQQASPPFTDPQVYLRDGQMKLYGKINRGIFSANMLIVMNVGIDDLTGKPKVEIASADFGPFPTPEGLNTAITAVIDEAFTGSLGPVAVGFRLESIIIADGVMTLTGRIK